MMLRGTLYSLLTAALAFSDAAAQGAGSVVRVIDGDTYEVFVDGKQIRARLANADTPETGERARCAEELEAGNRATAWMKEQVSSRAVVVISLGRLDKYKRLLVRITVDGRDLGELLVEQGLGRFYNGERRMPWCPEH